MDDPVSAACNAAFTRSSAEINVAAVARKPAQGEAEAGVEGARQERGRRP
jgi:hypothetical protein